MRKEDKAALVRRTKKAIIMTPDSSSPTPRSTKPKTNNTATNNNNTSTRGSATFLAALSYHTKLYIGPGCLSLPLAFERSGVVAGLSLMVLVFALTLRSQSSLLICKRSTAHLGVQSYSDLTRLALGSFGATVVDILTNIT